VAAESGADESALYVLYVPKNLKSTRPERGGLGLIGGSAFMVFMAVNRKPQIAAGKNLVLMILPPCGGCCFLTDESYSEGWSILWKAKKPVGNMSWTIIMVVEGWAGISDQSGFQNDHCQRC